MIKKLFSLALTTGVLFANAQQVQNPGFENWVSSNVPANWGSYGQMIAAATGTNPNTEIKTTTAHSGSFAALLQNQNVAIAGSNVPGGVNTGTVTLNGSGVPIYGFQAYTSTPVSYDFWYQFNAIGGDTAGTDVTISHWNTSLNKRDTLARGGAYIIGATTGYTHMTVPISWIITGVTPDSIQLQFTSSLKKVGGTNQPPTGGMMYLDDVNMNLLTGVQTFMAEGTFATYPNPASNVVTIAATSNKAKNALVYDVSGQLVSTYTLTDKHTSIDVTQYENGLYIYIITDEHNATLYTAKFNVAK